jgi:N-acyl-D-aspartate/D-glutamate deacylase
MSNYSQKLQTVSAVLLILASLVFSACSKPHESEAAKESVAEPVPAFDVVIRGGTLYDGSGEAGVVGDLAIDGDRIVAMGELGEASAKTEIDATGMAVAPGFINMMSWAPITLIQDGRGMSDIKQGITLEISCCMCSSTANR